MIQSITVINYLGESLELELARPEKSGFAVKSVDGLGPSKSNVVINGGIITSAEVETRNIVLTLIFCDDGKEKSIETIRQKSYKYFPRSKPITLQIKSDNRTSEISGIVESNEPDIFNKQEFTQISILCPDPDLYSTTNNGIVNTVFSGIEPLFEFPFSNESLTENLIEFASIQNKTENIVIYDGDSEVGVTITMHALGDVNNPIIYNNNGQFIKLDTSKLQALTGNSIIIGDDIIITTEKGNKKITLLRNGIYTNILNCLGKGSSWFKLSKGDNIFSYSADLGSTNLQFTVSNKVKYEGV